ncbi:MAG: GntR family transcriptional regulator [Actinomycetaceae bacterium]|nr:GntR family transcriptional regulator [Actinomycetaceae bacterium]
MQFDSSKPIWQQLIDEFARRIVTGVWPAGAKIPSVRELAAEVGVNPNTVQKSLVELERLGLAESERTAGRYVTNDQKKIDEARNEAARRFALEYTTKAQGLGLSHAQAMELLRALWAESEDQ